MLVALLSLEFSIILDFFFFFWDQSETSYYRQNQSLQKTQPRKLAKPN